MILGLSAGPALRIGFKGPTSSADLLLSVDNCY